MSETSQLYQGLLGRLLGPPAVAWALTSNDSSLLAWVNDIHINQVPAYRQAILQTSVKSAVVWACFYALGHADVVVPQIVEGIQAMQDTKLSVARKTRACGMVVLCGTTAFLYAGMKAVNQGECTEGAVGAALDCWLAGAGLLVFR